MKVIALPINESHIDYKEILSCVYNLLQRRDPHLGLVHAVQAVPEEDEPESPETYPS